MYFGPVPAPFTLTRAASLAQLPPWPCPERDGVPLPFQGSDAAPAPLSPNTSCPTDLGAVLWVAAVASSHDPSPVQPAGLKPPLNLEDLDQTLWVCYPSPGGQARARGGLWIKQIPSEVSAPAAAFAALRRGLASPPCAQPVPSRQWVLAGPSPSDVDIRSSSGFQGGRGISVASAPLLLAGLSHRFWMGNRLLPPPPSHHSSRSHQGGHSYRPCIQTCEGPHSQCPPSQNYL